MSLKNPVTLTGIDAGTVRIVAQRLNHYATPGPMCVCIMYVCIFVCTYVCSICTHVYIYIYIYIYICVCVCVCVCVCMYV